MQLKIVKGLKPFDCESEARNTILSSCITWQIRSQVKEKNREKETQTQTLKQKCYGYCILQIYTVDSQPS